MPHLVLPCDRPGEGLPRRSVLQLGATGLASLPVALGLAPTFSPLSAAEPSRSPASGNGTACILFWMAGGPSHVDTYDLKPHAPKEVRGPFAPIATSLDGFQINELMPGHARVADRLAIVRSLTHTLAEHDDASHWVQTGYPQPQARQSGQKHPCEGSVAARLRGPNRPGVPAYVCVPEDYASHMGFYQGPAFLGSRYRAVNAGGDPTLGNYRLPEFQPQRDVTDQRFSARQQLLSALDPHAAAATGPRNLSVAREQAFELVGGAASRQLFDASREPAALRDRYGRHAYGHAALLARRLVEGGVTFVTINLYEKDVDWWDDHSSIEKNLRKRLPAFDQAFATLIEDLTERGLLDRVLVAAYGEFGRGPRIDSQAGRSHWPRAFSAALAGGGLKTGQVIGATTADGGEVRDNALRPGDLLATVYHTLGIDPHQMVVDKLDRPVPLLPEGRPIRELVG